MRKSTPGAEFVAAVVELSPEEARELFPSLAAMFDRFFAECGDQIDESMTNQQLGAAYREWANRNGLNPDAFN